MLHTANSLLSKPRRDARLTKPPSEHCQVAVLGFQIRIIGPRDGSHVTWSSSAS